MLARSGIRLTLVRNMLAVAVLALLSTATARANSFTWSNEHGKNAVLASGAFNLSGSAMTSLPNGTCESLFGTATCGSLNFTTGTTFTPTNTTLGFGGGGTWSAGGSLTIDVKGLGVVFKGTFSGPVSFTLNSPMGCTSCEYSLTGSISGTYYANGIAAGGGVSILTGSTVQLDLTTKGTGLWTGAGGTMSDKGGTTNIVTPAVSPEPGSLVLMGTGLLGAGFLTRRRMKGSQ